MSSQRGLERQRSWFVRLAIHSRLHIFDLPDFGCVVGAACCQLLHVGRKQDPGDVLFVSIEVCHREQLCLVRCLAKIPYEYIALREC
jgi:hypothetical protein